VPDDPGLVMLTTMYLPADEIAALAELPGADLRKTRWRVDFAGRQVAVDEFHDRLTGLVLAETELSLREGRLPMPAFARKDVTDDDRFTGGTLAYATDDEINALLTQVDALLAGEAPTGTGARSSSSP
jgi:CYTH domain-containing protein